MATKLSIMQQIVTDLGTVFPQLTAGEQIYLTPKILAVGAMAPLEIQVCESGAVYPEHDGSCRVEDFMIQVGIFRVYRLDSDGRHAKALADITLSLFTLKETVVDLLDGSFLTENLLTRPLIIRAETAVEETKNEGQLLKIINFVAGLNVGMV